MTNARRRCRRARVVVALVTAALAVIGAGRPVAAHTDFDSSVPADGDVVEGPLSEIVVNFTNPARPAGDGFQLLDPDGSVRAPSAVDETDGTSFVLSFDPALGAGTYGLRWSVRAGDAHPIEGSFQFEISGAPTSSLPVAAAATVPASPTTMAPMDGMDAADHAAMTDDTLDEFLDVGSSGNDATPVGRAGRTITMLGTIFGVGVLAALVWTMRGRRDELVSLLTWVRLAGLVIAIGGFAEYASLTEADPTASFGSLVSGKPGFATALKMVGGLAVWLGFHRGAGRFAAPSPSLSAAVATDLRAPSDLRDGVPRQDTYRWTPTRTAALGVSGYVLVLVSFWFDGHTVSRGPWTIHSFVNLVHLAAAAVWAGGVFAMTAVAWMRHRRSEQAGLAAMVVRFSSIAAVSLAAVIAAGLVMTWMVIDGPGDLLGTDWGRVLVAKVAVVAVAAGFGGFNHFRLRPALEERPDDPHLAKELRVSLAIESLAFVTVVVLTAILVASAI